LLVAGILVALPSCDPAIARRKGVVRVARTADDPADGVKVCIVNTVDAGSSYGDTSPEEAECLQGLPEGTLPEPGDCIILQIQGEGSALKIDPAEGC